MQISFLSQTFFGDEIKVYKKKTDYGFYVEGRHDSIAVFNSMIILKNNLNEQDGGRLCAHRFLYNENHAIVAWFKRRSADERIANEK